MHYFRYQSCEASILLHWTKIDVWVCFGARARWSAYIVRETDLMKHNNE
jgi:hypothetical protein